jgi:hypothetical protein
LKYYKANKHLSLGNFSVKEKNGDLYITENRYKYDKIRASVELALYHSQTGNIIWLHGLNERHYWKEYQGNNGEEYHYTNFCKMFYVSENNFYVDSKIMGKSQYYNGNYATVVGVGYEFHKSSLYFDGKERLVECNDNDMIKCGYKYYDKCIKISLENLISCLFSRYNFIETEIFFIYGIDEEFHGMFLEIINILVGRSTKVILYARKLMDEYNCYDNSPHLIEEEQLDDLSVDDLFTNEHKVVDLKKYIAYYYDRKTKTIEKVKSARTDTVV